MSITAGAKRKDMTYLDPLGLCIVGIDIPDDPQHPCHDPERIALPLDPAMVDNVREYGVTLPVVCRLNGTSREVVDGKQRTRWGREAGLSSIPTIMVKGSDDEIRRMVRDLNSIRVDDPPSAKAAQAQRMLDRGLPEPFVAARFGIKPPMLARLLKMQDVAPEVQKLVDQGDVTLTDATTKIAKLPRDKQEDAAKPLTKGTKKRKTGKPSKAKIRKTADELERQGWKVDAINALRWAIGEAKAEGVLATCLAPEKKKTKKTGGKPRKAKV